MMSELHMGLIGLGALGVLGVVAYNAWVSYRHRKRAGSLLSPLEKDALFDMNPAPAGAMREGASAEETQEEAASVGAAWESVSEDSPESVPERARPAAHDVGAAHYSDAADHGASGADTAVEAVERLEAIDWGNRLDAGVPGAAAGEASAPAGARDAPISTETPASSRLAKASRDSAAAAFVASAARWLGALPRPFSSPRTGGAVSSAGETPASPAGARIEPGLGHAPIHAIHDDEGSSRRAAATWQADTGFADAGECADDGEFGEILASRPFDENERRAALAGSAAAFHIAPDPAVEPALASGPASDAAMPDMPVEPVSDVGEPLHLLSPAVDYIATLEAASGAPASEWLAAQRAMLARADKPVHWAGFDEESGEWVMFADGGNGGGGAGEAREDPRRFRRVRAGLQLADRRGALSENDLLVFATAMDALARDWQARGRAVMLDLPDPRPVPAVAADLDAFCASVDIQISLNVVALGEAFPGTKIRALAESAGMSIDGRGRFVRADDDGKVLYALISHDPAGFAPETMRSLHAHGLTFLFDVPTVARGERVFGQLVELAGRFAEALRGALVDDNRRPLSDASLAPIRQRIAQFQARMAQRNLPAGGRMARRLFS